ncbi:extracellular solute-binding protein [Planctomonas sp. JC2975]|nr:extracellular solute-binding protein [Planctomonas sp. JC2975]NNC12763.1 extracellular solute-binding protein [Planctomonas sp. JC2975]
MAGATVLTVTALALVGCSSSPSASSTSTAAPKLDKLTVMAPYLSTDAPTADNEVGQTLNKILGTDLEVNWVPNSSYGDKTNITLAGNDIPDAMVIQGKDAGFVKNANAGAFWDLTNYLKDYPNLVSSTPAVQQASSVNGKVYGIYRPRDTMRTAVIIRKDWLKKLGLSMPKTTDDLYKIAKAFTEDDPDGDGKKDTYGLIVPKWPGSVGSNSPWDAIESWYGAGNVWTQQNGKLVQSFTTPQWKKALAYEKKIVSNGYINPDYATMDSVTWNTPFLNGQGGIIIDTYSRVRQITSLMEKTDPTTYQNMIAWTGNLEGPDGKMHALPTSGYSGFIAIPKSSVKTEAQLRQVLSVLNKLNSKQAQILINNGIEGKNYNLVDGRAQAINPPTPESTLMQNTVNSYAQLGISVGGNKFYLPAQPNAYDQTQYDAQLKTAASDLKSAVYNPAAAYVSNTYVLNGATLDNIISDARIKYDAGQIDDAGLDAALKQWATSGGTQVTAEINKLYKADKNK